MSPPAVSPPAPATAAPTLAQRRRHALDLMHGIVALLLAEIGRPWRGCGRAGCRRRRRCTGVRCAIGQVLRHPAIHRALTADSPIARARTAPDRRGPAPGIRARPRPDGQRALRHGS